MTKSLRNNSDPLLKNRAKAHHLRIEQKLIIYEGIEQKVTTYVSEITGKFNVSSDNMHYLIEN